MAAKPPKSAKPNIRMVAKRVNLSPATVSLALRDSASIAPETRARVQAAARELNYVPSSRPARSPRAVERDLLFLTKDFGDRPVNANPFYGEILHGAEQEAASQDVKLKFTLLADVEEGAQAELPAIVADYKPHGVLLAGAYTAAIVRQVQEAVGVPLVLVDNSVPGGVFDSVMGDDFGGGWQVTQHLIDLGHRQIGVIAGDLRTPSFAQRLRGYRAACTRAGSTPATPAEAVWERSALHAAVKAVLAAEPRPTAIFCMTDAFAVFVMDILRDLGLRVPDDISVVGFDDLPIARMGHPPLTTVHNHPQTMGRLAVQRLLARIEGDQTPPLGVSVGTQLVVRASARQV